MAQPFVPGPSPIWIGLQFRDPAGSVGEEGQILFLGFTQRGADLSLNEEYSELVTDVGGAVPIDLTYQGQSGTLSFDLTRWREDTYEILCNHAANTEQDKKAKKRGREPAGRVGTIMALEQAAFRVYVPFPYSTVGGKYSDMPAGYRFLNCVLDRDSLPTRGSQPARLLLVFRCMRAVFPGLLNSNEFPRFGEDLFGFYDHDMGAIAGRLPD